MNKLTVSLLESVQPDAIERRIAPSLERRRLRAYILMLVIDAVLLQAGFVLAAWLYEGRWNDQSSMLTAQTIVPVFFTIALYNKTYGARALTDWAYATRKAIIALIVAAGLLNFVAFYTKSNADFSRVSVTLSLIFAALFFAGFRFAVQAAVKRFWGGRISNQLLIDDGGPSFTLDQGVRISASEYRLDPSSHDPFMLDRLGKVLRNQDKVVISCPYERREDWAFLLKSAGVHGELVSETAHRLAPVGVHRYEIQDRTTLVVSNGPLGCAPVCSSACLISPLPSAR
jgi:polysaccharide biosynthesis protein PslA